MGEQRRPTSRRSGTIPGRRFALALTLMLAVAAAPASTAAADGDSQPIVTATIYTAGGTSPDSVTLGTLQQNPQCAQYSEQSMQELGRQGFIDVPLPPAGAQTGTWPLSTILACLQTPVPPSAVSGITVMNSDGSPQEGPGSQITRADLASPSDFNNSAETAVIEDRGSVVQYDRPWRGSQGDEDFLDEVQESENGGPAPIAIEVFEGPLLTVTATASQTSVPVGTTVSFQANVSPLNQAGLSYTWGFDGAAPASTAAAPQVTFTSAGQYTVTVQVTDAAGGGGGGSVTISVGAQPGAATGGHNQTGAGRSRSSHTPGGPQRSRGNHAGGPAGKSSAGSSPPAGPPSSSGHPGPSGTPHSAGPTGATTPTSAPSHTSTTSSQAASGANHPGAASPPAGTTSTRAAPPPQPRSAPHVAKTQPRVVAPEGPLVAGRLISDVFTLPAGASPLVQSPGAQASAPPARQGLRTSPLAAVAGGLAVAVLFMLGVGRELRWPGIRRLGQRAGIRRLLHLSM